MQSIIRIKIPYHLTERTFNNDVLKDLFYSFQKRTKTVLFNFAGTTFVSSFAMILFIILCQNLVYNEHIKVIIYLTEESVLSKEGACVSILTRLGFFDALPSNITFYPVRPQLSEHLIGSNVSILELSKFKDQDEGLELIEAAERAILSNTDYSEEHVKDICVMISELMQNIFYHSEAKRSSLIAIQRYPKINLLQISVADSGVGIPATLRRLKKHKDIQEDFMIIFQSLKRKVSRFEEDQKRGEGLLSCRNLSKKHKACLYIRSNGGYIKVDFTKKPELYGDDTYELPGTQIYINFPMINNQDLYF